MMNKLFPNGASEMKVRTLSFPSGVQETKNTQPQRGGVQSEPHSAGRARLRGLPRESNTSLLLNF